MHPESFHDTWPSLLPALPAYDDFADKFVDEIKQQKDKNVSLEDHKTKDNIDISLKGNKTDDEIAALVFERKIIFLK